MKILREELNDKLENKFSNIVNRRRVLEQIGDNVYKKRNFLNAATYSILLKQRPLSDVSDKEIYWIIDSINQVFKENNEYNLIKDLKISDIFTDREIQMYDKSKFNYKKEDVYPITFDVIQVAEDQWLSTISSKKLFDLYKKQIINYNKNTQRPLKEVTRNGVRTYKINKNKSSVESIKNELKKGLFIPNCLTFNINMDNPSNDFNINNNELTLYSGQFDLIDGFHRYSAITELLQENPNIEFNFGIWIMNFDENKSCRFIAQEDKRNKISRSYTKSLDVLNGENFSSRIIQILNEDIHSPIKGKLSRYNDSNLKYDEIVITINDTFKCNSRIEANKTGENIIKNFEVLEDNYIDVSNLNSNELIFVLIGIGLLQDDKINEECLINNIKNYISSDIILNTRRKMINYYGDK